MGFIQTLIWLLFFTLVGAAMLRAGLRGIRVGNHPYCSRCGFDLFGRAEGAIVCSECGADLHDKGAITIGERERRWRLIGFGATLAFICLATVSVVVISSRKQFQLTQYKPDWLIVREARSADHRTSDTAGRELNRRLTAGSLSDSGVQSFVNEILDIQKDRSRAWSPWFGDFIESAYQRKQATSEQWSRYAQQAVLVHIECREQVQQGDPLPIDLRWEMRIGSNNRLFLADDVRVKLGDIERPIHDPTPGQFYTGGLRSGEVIPFYTSPRIISLSHGTFLAHLKPGAQTLNVKTKVALGPATRAVWTTADMTWPVTELTCEVPWTLLPSDVSSVKLIEDPSLEPEIRQCIEVSEGFNSQTLNVSFRDKPQVGLSFGVFIEAGDQERYCGDVTIPKERNNFGPSVFQLHWELPDTIDVIFRPNAAAAAETADVYEIWNGEIILKDVRLTEPATQP